MEIAFTKAWSGPSNGNGIYKGMETEKKHFRVMEHNSK